MDNGCRTVGNSCGDGAILEAAAHRLNGLGRTGSLTAFELHEASAVSAPASKEPRMGPVQLNETSARVRAMKKMPIMPPNLEAFWSMLFTQLLGRVISK